MLKFVPQDSNGRPQKRKFTQRACEKCRKSKKKCDHVDQQNGPENTPNEFGVSVFALNPRNSLTGSPSTSVAATRSPKRLAMASPRQTNNEEPSCRSRPTSSNIEDSSNRQSASVASSSKSNRPYTIQQDEAYSYPSVLSGSPQLIPRGVPPTPLQVETPSDDHSARNGDDDDSRFVGDTNPESIFLAATSPSTSTGSVKPDSLGVWLSRKPIDRRQYYSSLPMKKALSNSIYSPDSLISKLFLPHLEDQCLRLLPPEPDFQALSKIYFDDICPIFPVIEQDDLDQLPAEMAPARALMKQAICLAASTSSSARPHLRFGDSANVPVLEQGHFARQLALSMQTSINLGLLKDKVVTIQVLTMLAFFTQFSDDHHHSAELTARAVSFVQTTGLHLAVNLTDDDMRTRVFLCVWAVDRLNAAFHGRPLLIHERDVGRDMNSAISTQEGSFQLLLRILQLFDEVIGLYRPERSRMDPQTEFDFPTFEDLIVSTGAIRYSARILGTIETLYHSIAMLTCRTQFIQELPRSSVSHIRQAHSAARATAIVSDELHGQLSCLPLVPYAISLSLRVAYRELRLNKVPMLRMRARRQLLVNSGILRELGNIYSSCVSIADLAEQTIQEMDKVIVQAAHNQASHQSDADHGNDTAGLESSVSQPQQSNNLQQPQEGQQEVSQLPVSRSSVPHDPAAETLDFSLFDNMADFDVFAHFDPAFDLNAIDAALGDGINPTSGFNFNDSAS